MKIAIGGDHAGFEYKEKLVQKLESLGHEVKDFGPFSDASVDYPDYVHPLSTAIENGEYELGIVICGSGNGVAITANKHQGIRAALCWNEELAALARLHNNANVLALPARFISYELAEKLAETFLNTPFEGGRHANRVNKIACS
ncbi:MAG TPA: ribose 5-phosphate isomerase B [Algoriphagus sp.]|jgi:ribose 5-phosphate isomerase B|uniref:ribose 5-phosphate isomerase B n=1 Tax=unclassified Algoriphagus TaxID=2641541 RepID=UPI000C670AF8|nr:MULTISPECIES: ribose 5-phosphate isomerase B [unclassified Algoriphagus]MAL15416.1 ribose 5-phosphate isomerase B [Algoriphagus sp.]MAN86808.1 ribose 5-phosphate isomerase B [Algoriphagus sp.]QYH40362.1 ribose 5-phosphate isomerase B [Algoriphagus sp. NBT04N3]HAH36109.1 ribose 5-phosphate isomerase B [Algoriphagus sp.]HAS59585.1 ribose 5-phosphate isomerase B [Algoriphagus sp.]|tara:strand:- start:395 stop:826 length:432 start_codon:yes stop_codon:yes gene_type:complete